VTRGTIAIAAAITAAAALVAGCGGDPTTQSYVFNPSSSPIDVDTPALRAEKAKAAIEPCPKAAAGPSTAADALPDITLPCLGGGRDVDMARLRGPLVINFWAQNCPPCRSESPRIQHVYDAMQGRLRVIGVDWQDTQPDQAIALAHEMDVTYPQLADPIGATRAAFEIRGLPITVFVGSDGGVVYVYPGPIPSAGALARMVERHLGVNAGGAS
jgi:thiol-disulfide isomerase/thioredoxin